METNEADERRIPGQTLSTRTLVLLIGALILVVVGIASLASYAFLRSRMPRTASSGSMRERDPNYDPELLTASHQDLRR